MQVLLTAFEPYDQWSENSSWLALVDLLRARPSDLELITRRYPVDLPELRERLEGDLEKGPDAVLHLGQAPGISSVKLEAIALNIAGCVDDHGRELPQLIEAGPLAFQSSMPLGRWSDLLCKAGIPAAVSYHAGTFLCNATMYLSHHWHHVRKMQVPTGFMHLPLATEQVAEHHRGLPSLPASMLAAAVRLVLEDLAHADAEQTKARTH